MNYQKHDDRRHKSNLGTLVNNIQALETVIRGCLFKDELIKGISTQLEKGTKLERGEIVHENAFTNWDTLSELIKKYNKLSASKGLEVDETLVEIRDALAHGRTIAYQPDGIYQLVRFKKPKNGKVEVEFSVSLTEEWFSKAIRRFYNAFRKADLVQKRLSGEKP